MYLINLKTPEKNLLSGVFKFVTYVNIITGIIGVVIAVGAAFLISKILKAKLSAGSLKYFSYYNFAVGAIASVTGIIQIIIK